MSNSSNVIPFKQRYPMIAERGIDESTWESIRSSIYPGAKDESVLMAIDYCRARDLDIMLKPVHLVPMNVKDQQTGHYGWRDVPMPGIGLYRIQADRSGTYAGADDPQFGPLVTKEFFDKNGKPVTVEFPEWCKYTVHKLVGDRVVAFTAKEYWIENYATDSGKSSAPNAMWSKRVYGQLAKCAEAQALRKAWPEIGSAPTAEEMEGKVLEKDITPEPQSNVVDAKLAHKQAQGDDNSNQPKEPQAEKTKTAENPLEGMSDLFIELADKIAWATDQASLVEAGNAISEKADSLSEDEVTDLRQRYSKMQKILKG